MSVDSILIASQRKRTFDDEMMGNESPMKVKTLLPRFKRISESRNYDMSYESFQEPSLNDYKKEMVKLEGMLKNKNQELQQKQETINNLQKQILEMKAQLEQANKLNEVCGGLRQLVSTKEKTIVEQRKIIDKLQKDNRLYARIISNNQMGSTSSLDLHDYGIY